MGKRLEPNKKRGPSIHADIVTRWDDILQEGLPIEDRKKIYEKYPVPENCTQYEPPTLNKEIKASLAEAILARDKRIAEKQEKVTVCLAALGSTLSKLSINEAVERVEIIRILSDVTRMLIDLQRDETLTRRLILMANLNPTLKETLVATKPGEWLFGSDLTETLKAAKSLEKSSKDLKPVAKNTATTSLSKPKNSKGPPHLKKQQTAAGGHRRPFTPAVRNSSRHRSSSARSYHSRYRRHRHH